MELDHSSSEDSEFDSNNDTMKTLKEIKTAVFQDNKRVNSARIDIM